MRRVVVVLALFAASLLSAQTGNVYLAGIGGGTTATCNVGSAEKGDLSAPCVITVHNDTGSTFQFYRWYFIEHATAGPWSNTRTYAQGMFVTYIGKCWEATGGGNVGKQPDITPAIWTDITTTYPNGCKNTTMQADGDAVVRTWGDNCETLANQQNGGDYHIPFNYPLANGATCTINAYLKPTVEGASTGHVYIKAANGTTLDTITINGTGTAVPWNKTATLPTGITKTGAHTYSGTVYATPTGNPSGCTGAVITDGDILQTRLNSASATDILCLQAGSTLTKTGGTHFLIPALGGSGPNYLTIITTDYASLPSEGNRIDPSYAAHLPTLSATGDSVLQFASGASYVRLKGIKIDGGTTDPFAMVYTSPYGFNATDASMLGNHIVFDQVYFYQHSDGGGGGIEIGNGSYMAVINSYFDIDNVNETQCMSGTNGPGPIKILNNYCQIPSEGLLFGGGDSTILGGNPSDIEVRNNYFTALWTWNKWCVGPSNPCPGGQVFDGKSRTVKNRFEYKKAVRALVTGNVFGPAWADGQTASVLMEPADQSGSDVGATVRDVTYDSNIIDGAAIAFASVATSYAYFSQGSKHIVFTNNLMKNVGGAAYGTTEGATYAWCYYVNGGTPGGGKLYLQPNYFPGEDYSFTHNTCAGDSVDGFISYDATSQTFKQINGGEWKDNLTTHGTYGMWFNGPEVSNVGTIWQNYDITNNGFIGGNSGNYDATFQFVASSSAARFADYAGKDFRLCTGAGTPNVSCVGASPFHNTASDGTDVGADVAQVNTATSCAISGLCGSYTPPVITKTHKGGTRKGGKW